MSTFDMEPVDAVQQEDETYPDKSDPVNVCVKGRVLVDELPTILGPCKNFILEAGAGPVQILDRNDRRKSAMVEIQNGDICVGGTIGEARDYVGAVWSGGLSVPRHVYFQSEFWARGVLVDVTGTAIDLTDSTDAVLVSVTEEFWTR